MTAYLQRTVSTLPTNLVPFPVRMLEGSTLVFSVGREQEYVHLRLVSNGEDLDLGDRVHNVTLYELAQERRADEARGLPDTSCGWLFADHLAKELDVSLLTLNMYVFRARGVLAAHGVVDATRLIERRRSTGQLRIGAKRLEILNL
jgi:hypothetical protein